MTQAEAEAAPYHWEFFTTGLGGAFGEEPFGSGLFGSGHATMYHARRRQAGGMIQQTATTSADLLTKITSYEAQFSRAMFADNDWYTLNVGGARVHRLLVSLGT